MPLPSNGAEVMLLKGCGLLAGAVAIGLLVLGTVIGAVL